MMARLQEYYRQQVVKELVKQFGYHSVMQVP
ncbi:MAG: 50S ribosomal protein L5, partial [Burkholderiales bacterium]